MRYLPHTTSDRQSMLAAIGAASVSELFEDVPVSSRLEGLLNLPRAASEMEVERLLSRLAAENTTAGTVPFFAGCGAYRHHVPASVDHLIQRSEFLTSYTPYQPEIAQGTLQYLFEFQSQVALLTGMDAANASMYDGSTAAAEAVLAAHRVTRRRKALISGDVHPHYRDVILTLSHFSGHEAMVLPRGADMQTIEAALDADTSCIVMQNPDVFGEIGDLSPVTALVHANNSLLIAVVTEALSMGAIQSPGSMGADIVAAEGQSIGNALNFGGPYLGLFAAREKFVRQMPGRLCGETVDEDGRRGFVLTLSAREQHIRREKATSNICTNSGLCALAFTIHMSLLGDSGLKKLARLNHARAVTLAEALGQVRGVTIENGHFFNEFTIRVPRSGVEVIDALAERGVIGGVPAARLFPDTPELQDRIVVAATETVSPTDIETYARTLAEVL
jgi:glycine dehydrogenase subunit 1